MIQSIRLQHFRSYADESFEFNPGVNIIVGPNASGKTNLLEAILVGAHGVSYRAHDEELIAFNSPWARIDILADEHFRTLKLVREPQFTKTYEIDGKIYRRLPLERTIPTVLFEPNHLSLLTGSPDRRRDYLDELLAQTIPGFGSTLRAYRRTLAQRNKLLKSSHLTNNELFPWNVRLSELGGRLVRARMGLVQQVNDRIGSLYDDLSKSGTSVAVLYRNPTPSDQYESYMLRQLESRLHQDQERGFTSFGPHREDMVVLFNSKPADEVASRGETRTFVLGLKIIEMQIIEGSRGQTPILLLDDVFSELDGARRRALTEHLSLYQTFITTTDADVVLHHFSETSTVIPIATKS